MKTKKLHTLIQEADESIKYVFGDTEKLISSIEYNSNKVYQDSLFIAVPGFTTDGHSYIMDAVSRGASTVLVSKERIDEFSSLEERGVALLGAADTRKSLPLLSSIFYGNPTMKVPVIGITGTNGKTSITYMLESILKYQGYSPGVVGTVNYRWSENEIQSNNTTPESKDLQEIFSNMIVDGVDVIIFEVSSHALNLFRADNIDFDIVIFTNLTRDHLDFHETFEEYFTAKKRIFDLLDLSRKNEKYAIVNIDDDYGSIILNEKDKFASPMFSFGIGGDADYKIDKNSIVNTIEKFSYDLENPEKGLRIELAVAGKFQAYNSLCAFAACHKMGIPVPNIQHGLLELNNIPGRFDIIRSEQGFSVIVDYAHTDDALLNLLKSARELNPKRIITLIGCGGNRDKTKRPLMGEAAVSNSDWVIVTSDNPRDEKPEDIIEDIVSGLVSSNFEIQPDRKEAIKKAVNMAEKDDLVVIAGKGHEDYQIIGKKRINFDDRSIANEFIKLREIQ